MRKILEYDKIPVHHAPFDCQVLSILWNNEFAFEWIASHFLHLRFRKDMRDDYFYPKQMLFVCPFLTTYVFPYFFVRDNFKQFTDFVEIMMEKDFYVYFMFNNLNNDMKTNFML